MYNIYNENRKIKGVLLRTKITISSIYLAYIETSYRIYCQWSKSYRTTISVKWWNEDGKRMMIHTVRNIEANINEVTWSQMSYSLLQAKFKVSTNSRNNSELGKHYSTSYIISITSKLLAQLSRWEKISKKKNAYFLLLSKQAAKASAIEIFNITLKIIKIFSNR